MSRDLSVKLGILAATGLIGAGLLSAQGMTFTLWENLAAAGVVATLWPVALFYHQRRSEEFVITLTAVMMILVYFSCFTLVMYGGAALSFPLIDDALVAADRALGVHVPSIVTWAERHPAVQDLLFWAYHSTILQTLLIVIVLGFAGNRRRLESFVLQFMLCLTITGAIFIAAPAEGPFTAYDYEPTAHQSRYLQHLQTVRSGERTQVVLKESEGLITFPSFHAAWAVLLAAAVRHRRRWFYPAVLLNAAVIFATLTTGWHYFTDLLGGFAVAAIAIAISRRLEPWLTSEQSELRPAGNAVPPQV